MIFFQPLFTDKAVENNWIEARTCFNRNPQGSSAWLSVGFTNTWLQRGGKKKDRMHIKVATTVGQDQGIFPKWDAEYLCWHCHSQ